MNRTESRTEILSRGEGRQFSSPGTRTVCGWRLGMAFAHLPSKRRRSYSHPPPELCSSLDLPKRESKAERGGAQLNYEVWLGSPAALLSQLSSAQEHDGSWTPRYFQGTTWQSRRISHVTEPQCQPLPAALRKSFSFFSILHEFFMGTSRFTAAS